MRRYPGHWGVKGEPEDETRCIAMVFKEWHFYQCQRKRPDGALLCWQHARDPCVRIPKGEQR